MVRQCSIHMQRFTYNFTNFADFASPRVEQWLAPHELQRFAREVAQQMLSAVPDLHHKGICVTIFGEDGSAAWLVPLDTVH